MDESDGTLGQCQLLMQWLLHDFPSIQSDEREVDLIDAACDGRILAEALHQLDRECFPSAWLEHIIIFAPERRQFLRGTNLRKLEKGIRGCYSHYGQEPGDTQRYSHIDRDAIEKKNSPKELLKLLDMVCGIAFVLRSADDRRMSTSSIVEMSADIQTAVHAAIMRLCMVDERDIQESPPVSPVKHPVGRVHSPVHRRPSSSTGNTLDDLRQELELTHAENKRLRAQITKLEDEHDTISSEKELAQQEYNRLLEKVGADVRKETAFVSSRSDELDASKAQMADYTSAELKDLRARVDELEQANEELQTVKEDQDRKLNDLMKENEDLKEFAKEFRRAKDENDELKVKERQWKKDAANLETYKRKIDEQTDLKRENRILDEKNKEYMKKMIDLDDEQRLTATLKQQMASDKKVIKDLESKLQERGDQLLKLAEQEAEHKRETVMLRNTVREQQETIDELRSTHAANAGELSGDAGAITNDLDDIINQDIPFNGTELSPNDLRETIIRLRKQLEQHRRGGVSYDMYEALQTDLDNAMRGKRDAERSQSELEQQLRSLQSELNEVRVTVDAGERAHNDSRDLMARCERLEIQLQKMTGECEQLRRQRDESQAAAAAATAQLEAVMHDSGVGSVRTHRDGMTSSASTSSDTHEAVMAKAVTIIKKQDALTQTLGKIVDAGGVTSKKEFQTITNEHRTVVEQLEKNAEELKRVKLRSDEREKLMATRVYAQNLEAMREHYKLSASYSEDERATLLGRQRQHAAASAQAAKAVRANVGQGGNSLLTLGQSR